MIIQTHGPALSDLIDDLPFDLEDPSQTEVAGDFCALHAQVIMMNLGNIFRDTTIPPTPKMITQLTDLVDELTVRYPLRNVALSNQREVWLECLADLARTYEQAIAEVYFKAHPALKRVLTAGFVSNGDRNEFLHAVVLGKIRAVHDLYPGRDRKIMRLSVAIDGIIQHLELIKPQYEWSKHLERCIKQAYEF